jgi:hypothetical protein
MWWLKFRTGDAVILRASSLIHARMVAAKYGFGKPSHFAEGQFVDPAQAALIDDQDISRMLSPIEAKQLRKRLHRHARERSVDRPDRQQRSARVDLAAFANALACGDDVAPTRPGFARTAGPPPLIASSCRGSATSTGV